MNTNFRIPLVHLSLIGLLFFVLGVMASLIFSPSISGYMIKSEQPKILSGLLKEISDQVWLCRDEIYSIPFESGEHCQRSLELNSELVNLQINDPYILTSSQGDKLLRDRLLLLKLEKKSSGIHKTDE